MIISFKISDKNNVCSKFFSFEKILRAHNTHKEEIHVLYRKSFISIKRLCSNGQGSRETWWQHFCIFTRNPRGGKAKAIDEKDIEKFLAFAKEHEFGKIVAHAPYTMNLCSAKEDIRKFSKEMIADDMKRMEYIPGNYYNFHPGSHTGQGVETGIEYIAQTLNEIITPEQSTTILLETMAGKGSEIGRNFEEIRTIIDKVELDDKLGVCFDTCHVWDAGYDIVDNLDGVLEEFDKSHRS